MLLLFYSSIIFSLIFLTIAFLKKSWIFLGVSVLLAIPYSFYFAGYPMLRFALFIPIMFIALFYIVKRIAST